MSLKRVVGRSGISERRQTEEDGSERHIEEHEDPNTGLYRRNLEVPKGPVYESFLTDLRDTRVAFPGPLSSRLTEGVKSTRGVTSDDTDLTVPVRSTLHPLPFPGPFCPDP